MWLKNWACHALLNFELQMGVACSIFESQLFNFAKLHIFWRQTNDIHIISKIHKGIKVTNFGQSCHIHILSHPWVHTIGGNFVRKFLELIYVLRMQKVFCLFPFLVPAFLFSTCNIQILLAVGWQKKMQLCDYLTFLQ